MLGRFHSSSLFLRRTHSNNRVIQRQLQQQQLQPRRRHRHLRSSSISSTTTTTASTITTTNTRKLRTTTTTTISKRKKSTTTTRTTTSTSPSTATTNPLSPVEPCETPSDSKLINAPRSRGRDDDALSRYPNFRTAGGILRGFDYVGTLTFALTGCVTAAQSGLDVFGCTMVATITAVGGGTIRDAVFLSKRPFWTSETEYIWMTVLMGLGTFFIWPYYVLDEYQNQKISPAIKEEEDVTTTVSNNSNNNDNNNNNNNNNKKYDQLDAVLDTLDAVGLSAFAIIGAQNGVRAGMPMVVSAICGMATSTFGGLTRDVLCGRPVRIVHSNAEVYAFPALAGAVMYLVAKRLETVPPVRIGSAFVVCMGSRYVAVKHDVKLHTWDTQNDGLGISVRK